MIRLEESGLAPGRVFPALPNPVFLGGVVAKNERGPAGGHPPAVLTPDPIGLQVVVAGWRGSPCPGSPFIFSLEGGDAELVRSFPKTPTAGLPEFQGNYGGLRNRKTKGRLWLYLRLPSKTGSSGLNPPISLARTSSRRGRRSRDRVCPAAPIAEGGSAGCPAGGTDGTGSPGGEGRIRCRRAAILGLGGLSH
jgi:hypothetical protein